ncbi:EGF-like repeat and discoidin I-like domain-containing protein 3 [Anneissia japonica]|uniref:EGF-like repeat and discoidin I-like domain-containing protein 3 n=1 Tax=Anneissia japonica TaxID=1529436 RepID=UPI00142575DC|nr:EGF-like repeat and discoidin I-like domain-containing protein 3 [Anneissia japonica]
MDRNFFEDVTNLSLLKYSISELCIDPLGIEDGTIPVEQLSASSEYSFVNGAHRGRLNTEATDHEEGAWSSGTTDQNQWIQVDLGKRHKVHGVITQGRNKLNQWVTSYEILYSIHGKRFQPIRNPNCKVTTFVGNSDQDTTVTNTFSDPVYAQFVRIHPTDWYNWISLRFEVLGCSTEFCIDPLGIEDGTISMEQLSASSDFGASHGAHRGRLNTEEIGSQQGAWSSRTNDQYQWIQVDLGKLHEVRGIITQGRNGYIFYQWVTSYEILYSVDGNFFQPIRNSDGQETNFVGNSDRDTNVTNIFPEPVFAQFVRIHPTGWHIWISLRFEVLGCSAGLVGNSTYYKSYHRNQQCSITTENTTTSCIRCAVVCMRALECKYFRYDGECHIYTCSNNGYFVAFQYG